MTARRLCRGVLTAFLVLYALALLLFAIGTFGLFGSPQGPLAGVLVVVLGLPWSPMLDAVPDPLRAGVAALAPALNAGILALLCRVRLFR